MFATKNLGGVLRRRGQIAGFSTNNVELAAAYNPPRSSSSSPALLNACVDDSQRTTAPDETYLFPPPNVTGKLHMGHALTVTIQDSVARFRRLQGKRVRWVYGTDHAGIATQSVVEKQLAKNEGLHKDELGREEFVKRVWKWSNDYKGRIRSQLQELYASLDYENEYFTLDDHHSKAVVEAFVQLHERGLLKRAQRMVNWCPQLRTALSDLEVERESLDGPTEIVLPTGEKETFGIADDFAYKLDGAGDEELVVRTTRLESMLGDVAVAVHPEDARHKHLIGKQVIHPFTLKKLPIVADAVLVDQTVGTGAVKITPAHDVNDFDCAQRLKLPLGNCLLTNEGRMSEEVPWPDARGKSRFFARNQIRQELKKRGLYRGQVSNPMVINKCSRTGDIIEPILKWQWFLNGKALAERAQDAVSKEVVSFYPPEQRSIWDNWLNNSQDWCVSRQLWWGHRIPVYRKLRGTESEWIAARDENEARKKLKLGENDQIEQDEDVLDTWFSSGLLPISVFGWPERKNIPEKLTWMETGSDILFFWVARMVMLCTELNGHAPFPHIHLHPMVRDKRGRKMSKSLGNVIDPMDVINGVSLDEMIKGLSAGNLDKKEVARASADLRDQFGKSNGIPAFGADSLRLALASYSPTIPFILFDLERVNQARLFCNKLWQATRFILARKEQATTLNSNESIDQSRALHVRWLRHRLSKCMKQVEEAYSRLDVCEASVSIREFVWNDFCDVFLECVKLEMCPKDDLKCMLEAIEACLTALHPVAPRITLDLWAAVSQNKMNWNLAKLDFEDESAHKEMNIVLDIVRALRALKIRYGHVPKDFGVVLDTAKLAPETIEMARRLARANTVSTTASQFDGVERFLVEPLSETSGVVFVNDPSITSELRNRATQEASRIKKRLTQLEASLNDEQNRMSSPSFRLKAPDNVRNKAIEKIKSLESEISTLGKALESFSQDLRR